MIRQNNVQQVKEVIIAWATWRAEHAIGWIPYVRFGQTYRKMSSM